VQHWKSTACRQNYLAPFVTSSYSPLGYVVLIQGKCRPHYNSSKSIDVFRFNVATPFLTSSLQPGFGKQDFKCIFSTALFKSGLVVTLTSLDCSSYQSNVINFISHETEIEIYKFARKFLSYDNFVHVIYMYIYIYILYICNEFPQFPLKRFAMWEMLNKIN
jgi:hypothetical protein